MISFTISRVQVHDWRTDAITSMTVRGLRRQDHELQWRNGGGAPGRPRNKRGEAKDSNFGTEGMPAFGGTAELACRAFCMKNQLEPLTAGNPWPSSKSAPDVKLSHTAQQNAKS